MENNTDNLSFELQNQRRIIVLLIDDQRMTGEIVRRMLADETDIDFHFCQDPAQAIPAAIAVSPTVILQDLVMPDIDGLTLVKYFRAEPATRDIPLIVLSSEEDAKVKADAFALGANDYLIKLPDRVELVARIRYHSRGYIHMLERNEAFDAMVKTQKALAAELAEAADYVFSLLPPKMDEDITIDWKFVPSTSLGGDGFGYHWLDDDHFAIYLLDVAGHGVGAALLSVSVTEVLRNQTLPETDFYDPANVLDRLNRVFKMQDHNHKFFTIWYGVFNRATGDLTYATGGHPPATLINGDSPEQAEVVQLRTPGAIIGALDDIQFANATVRLKPFNRLYIYSDGTFEIVTPDDNMWDFDEYLRLLTTPQDSDYPDVEAIHHKVTEVKGSTLLDDDFSLMRIAFPVPLHP